MIEKFILHGEETYNLAPFKYPWAYTMADNSLSNHWSPKEVNMGRDKACFDYELTESERWTFLKVFATLTTSDLAIASNLTEQFFGLIKAAEIRLYLGRQIAEECLHSVSYQHVIEILCLDQDEIYLMYREVPEIAQWFNYAKEMMTFREGTDILIPMMWQYGIWEGTFFPTGFAAIYSLQRMNKMVGTGEQIQLIHKDETMHIGFGAKLVTSIMEELGSKPHQDDVHAMFYIALQRLDAWADYCIKPVLGYNAEMHKQHSRFLADRRLKAFGYDKLFHQESVLPWLDSMAGIRKEKNFFETRVTEYQSGGSLTFEENDSMFDISNWR